MRKIILVLSCLIILITGCSKNDIQKEKNNTPTVSYYKEEYQNRYLEYEKKYPNLTEIDVITRVNIGLDQPYYTNTKETPYLNQNYILSNKYFYMPNNYIPNNLETINPNYTTGTKLLVKEAKESFEQLASDAKNQGYTIRAMSAYRSYDYQVVLYNKYVAQDGQKLADTYSARPGYSEHQTGLVVDVDNGITTYTDFEKTKEFKWMQENAHKYGFILRYPQGKENITGYTYESWHYRYVGRKIAEEIKNQDITFDEYYIRFIDK